MDDPESFLESTALSFQMQPSLGALFDAVARGNQPLTFVVGAGVSLDAGLPTWGQLLDGIAGEIEDPELQALARKDANDPMRRAEYLLPMASEHSAGTEVEVVKRVLYKGGVDTEPGALADAVARLVVQLDNRVSLYTTNFDKLLSVAMARYLPRGSRTRDWGLEEADDYKQGGEGKSGHVLHLHGILAPGENAVEPVILKESMFLKYGREVRELIYERLTNSVVIFVGVSLSDPNLVGPLWDLALAKNKAEEAGVPDSVPNFAGPFVFIVTGPLSEHGDSYPQEQYYTVKTAGYLEKELGVATIFFKSYGQQTQALYDLSLAVAEPQRYLTDAAPESSLRYGPRLTRALDDIYGHIGCASGDVLPNRAKAQLLSEALAKKLERIVADVIDPARRSLLHKSARFWQDEKVDPRDLEDEHFGLFLWLRTRAENGSAPAYRIALMGSSAYVHRESWSTHQTAAIEPRATYAAARCLYFGKAIVEPLPQIKNWQLWRSIIAVPITRQGYGSQALTPQGNPRDVLTVGAVTLNSTRYIEPLEGSWANRRSQLSLFRPHHGVEVRKALTQAGQELVDPDFAG